MHADVCEHTSPMIEQSTGGFETWSAKRSNRTTGDLMRTDPRGFPSWPEAVTASLRGRIH